MKTIVQNFKVIAHGTDVTDIVDTAHASMTLNRLWDVVTIGIERDIPEGSDVIVTLGDYTFSGFVFASSKDGYDHFSVECRSHNAKLGSPFFQKGDVVYDEAATSSELWQRYTVLSGVPIVSTEVDLSFGVAYKRSGTPAEEIMNICDVTKADFFDNGGGVTIEPKKDTLATEKIISDTEYENFISTTQDIDNSGIRWVIINEEAADGKDTGGTDEEDKGSIKYTVGDDATIEITANADGVLKGTKNLYPPFHGWNMFPLREKIVTINGDTIDLGESVKQINNLKVNGMNVGYHHAHGSATITFNSVKRGYAKIEYVANAFRSKVQTRVIPGTNAKSWQFDALVSNVWEEYQGLIRNKNGEGSIPDDENDAHADGFGIAYSMTGDNYERGFSVFASADVGIHFTIDGKPGDIAYTHSAKNVTITKKFQMEDGNKVKVPKDAVIVGAKLDGVHQSYTVDTAPNSKHLIFNKSTARSLDITYTTHGIEYKVKDTKKEGSVVMLFRDGSQFDLRCSNPDDIRDAGDTLPVTVPDNIAEEMGLPVSAVAGVTLTIKKDGVPVWSGTVDEFGFIYPVLTEVGVYEVDIDKIIVGAEQRIFVGNHP